MDRLLSVDDWKVVDWNSKPDGSWNTMMARVAAFHSKHDFANPENNGHDMGYRVALTIEELGEFAAAITKGKPKQEASEELADLLILILGHSLAMQVDLESEFHSKMDKIMQKSALFSVYFSFGHKIELRLFSVISKFWFGSVSVLTL